MRAYLVTFVYLWVAALGCAQADAAVFYIRGNSAGALSDYTVRGKESLSDVARRFDLGLLELTDANPDVNVRRPQKGTKLIIPTLYALPPVREGIVINLAALRLFYFDGSDRVYTFPVSVGKEGWQTPGGVTKVVRKKQAPTWAPPDSIRQEDPSLPAIVPAGPGNPLGNYALYLSWPGYAIHGTNAPSSIGKRVSHGCIRLYPEDIAVLFDIVQPGTQVVILDDVRLSGESATPSVIGAAR